MPSQIITVTLQAALFSALSTTLAQSIKAYQRHTQTLQAFTSNTTISTTLKSPSHSQSQSLLQTFSLYSLLSFMLIAVIMTPPNYLYQRYLEDTFPCKVAKARSGGSIKENEWGKLDGERLSKSNTLAKFCLDRSIAAMANTAGFIVLAGLTKGRGVNEVLRGDLQKDFLPMILASWRVWPPVTLLNLVIVPFDYRMIVGNIVGVCWGVYVTLQTM